MTMRLSEILGRVVCDHAGRTLGRVHDVTAERIGELGNRDAIRVTGIVCGRGSLGARLGYATDQEAGPLLLRATIGRLARSALFIPWESIRVDEDRIVVTAPVQSLRHPAESWR